MDAVFELNGMAIAFYKKIDYRGLKAVEAFPAPISAVVTIIACCAAIALTLINPPVDQDPQISQSISRKAYYSTHAERLLNRYLGGEEPVYDQLFHETRAAYGEKAGEELLKSVETAIQHETRRELRGRLYTLRGILLMESGLKERAAESLKTALNLDPLNKTAADTLNTILGVGGGRSSEYTATAEKPEKPF